MVFRFNILVLLVLVGFSHPLMANRGLSFLKIGPSSREQALGNVGVASAVGSAKTFYNPSLLLKAKASSVGFSQHFWLLDTYSANVSAHFKNKASSYGVALHWLSVRDIPFRTSPTSEPVGYFNSQNAALSFAYAKSLSKKLDMGITAKLLYEKLFVDDATGYGVDLSCAYTLTSEINLGLALQNVGSMSELSQESSSLPTLLRSGISYALSIESLNSHLINEINLVTVFSEQTSVHVGHEFAYNQLFFARFGYVFGNDARSISTGFGIHHNHISFDYAFIPFSNDLGSASILTVEFHY